MSNINRDYLVVLDVKSSTFSAPNMYFYNTDKGTSNIYVQMVIRDTIVSATPIENASDFVIKLSITKDNTLIHEMTGVLVNEEEAIYEFNLPLVCTELSGKYRGEFNVKGTVESREEHITSFPISYKVRKNILTGYDPTIKG